MTGILLLNKPQNMTSFVAANRVKRFCAVKKTGHTGTLDPMATGVLPILLGGATRFCELLPTHDKAYRASLKLGVTTDTLDIWGEVLEQREVHTTFEQFKEALASFEGTTMQMPPMYSAISQNGVRLYKLARQGIEVERPKREVTIHCSIVSHDDENHEYTIDVECSSGTYIRSLISDLGDKLGCGAVMTGLVRTKANGFSLSDCITLEELEKHCEDNSFENLIIPVDSALSTYSKICVTSAQAKRFANGGELSLERLKTQFNERGEYIRVYSPENEFIGIGEVCEQSLAVKRLLIR